jgi:transcriptional regulator with XRE-family HTH domain
MISTDFLSPSDLCHSVAARAREARLAADLSQQGLADRAGVSLGSLKRFERTGAASFEAVTRIAIALGLEAAFDALFQPPKFTSLDEILTRPAKRLRGRKK